MNSCDVVFQIILPDCNQRCQLMASALEFSQGPKLGLRSLEAPTLCAGIFRPLPLGSSSAVPCM